MKTRIIINSSIDDDPLIYVQRVIQEGKISDNGNCYCYATVFKDRVVVTCKKTKLGFSFEVFNQ